MKLSIYLLRAECVDFEGVLQPKNLAGAEAFVQLSLEEELTYECRAFVQINKARPPRWAAFLSPHFNTANLGLLNQSSSFVLLVKAAGRMFAVTFGHGF